MPMPTLLDRGRGCLLGLAIGDALGGPLEGLTPHQIRAHYGTVADFVDGARAWRRKPYRWRLPGLYTDDTQQALTLAEVLLDHGRIVPQRVAELYLALANPRGSYVGAHRGVGRSFRQVLEDLERGVSPEDSGQDSAGISASVRIAPLALYFRDQPDALFDAVLAASLITHRDIRSLAGAVAVGAALRRLLNGEAREPSLLFRVAGDVARAEDRMAAERPERFVSIREHGRSLSRSIALVESVLDLERGAALQALVEQANRHGARPPCRQATRGFPPACIPTCLYLLLMSESPEDALVDVVNLGGDADSAGAILGAMAGAHWGAHAFPARWLDGLLNRDGVEQRAEALIDGTRGDRAIPDLVATERQLSEREAASRDGLMVRNNRSDDLGAHRHH